MRLGERGSSAPDMHSQFSDRGASRAEHFEFVEVLISADDQFRIIQRTNHEPRFSAGAASGLGGMLVQDPPHGIGIQGAGVIGDDLQEPERRSSFGEQVDSRFSAAGLGHLHPRIVSMRIPGDLKDWARPSFRLRINRLMGRILRSLERDEVRDAIA